MHAVLEALNFENIISYGHKVFRLGSLESDDISEFIKQGTWIVSYCAHTMKRFHRCVKANVKDKSTINLDAYFIGLDRRHILYHF